MGRINFRHWILFANHERKFIGKHKTDFRLTPLQMAEHAQAVSCLSKWDHAHFYCIGKEDETGAIHPITELRPCR